jgi:L-fucose isomerase-like protein
MEASDSHKIQVFIREGEFKMYLPLGTFSPDVNIALVSASRDCFPRELSETRTANLLKACEKLNLSLFVPVDDCRIIETKAHAVEAVRQIRAANCDGAVLFLGNFSPEIEDAFFVKRLNCPVTVIAASEESVLNMATDRGDALCGMLSAMLAIKKRDLMQNVFIPPNPVLNAEDGARAIDRFFRIMKVVKGVRSATLGLFGPRPRDFETCNYNLASMSSLGVEIEEFGFFDLANEARRAIAEEDLSQIITSMQTEMSSLPSGDFANRLAAYEKAVLTFRDQLKLSGMTTQCWTEQEEVLKHVPCYINARMAARGFPIACENDAHSLAAELLGQYATDQSVTILDLNHSIPQDLDASLADYPLQDVVGLFHCGNTDPRRLKGPSMKYQLIMNRLMEPEGEPDITRGTIEGQIAASPITVLQVHGIGDTLQAYIMEGEFLDLDPKTFGCTGTAYLPGFRRFYRHVLLGRFHHHAAVAFDHCGGILYDALTLLGLDPIFTPLNDKPLYPGENPFG